jgi:hypothetical protein
LKSVRLEKGGWSGLKGIGLQRRRTWLNRSCLENGGGSRLERSSRLR